MMNEICGTIGASSKNRGIFQCDYAPEYADVMFATEPVYTFQDFKERFERYSGIEQRKENLKGFASKRHEHLSKSSINDAYLEKICMCFFFSDRTFET